MTKNFSPEKNFENYFSLTKSNDWCAAIQGSYRNWPEIPRDQRSHVIGWPLKWFDNIMCWCLTAGYRYLALIFFARIQTIFAKKYPNFQLFRLLTVGFVWNTLKASRSQYFTYSYKNMLQIFNKLVPHTITHRFRNFSSHNTFFAFYLNGVFKMQFSPITGLSGIRDKFSGIYSDLR